MKKDPGEFAVRKMKDYIDDRLHQPITLIELSRQAGYSPYHAARIFKRITGQPPFEYIRVQRLLAASRKLRDEPVRVIDVAFDFVFDSHEGFTRAFSRQFGMSPQDYRSQVKETRAFLRRIAVQENAKMKEDEMSQGEQKVEMVFVQVIARPARKLILKRGIHAEDYFGYCEEVGCDLWETLTQIKEALYEPCGFWLPQHLRRPGTSVYVQGVEVPADYDGPIPTGLEMVDLKPCHMMIFQGPPFLDEAFCTAIDRLQEEIERYDPTLYGFTWADQAAPRFQMEPAGYRGYIEGRPVRPLTKGAV